MRKFVKWVYKNGGPPKVAKKLGVSAHAVRTWTRGEVVPRPDTMKKIVKLSRGAITFSDLLRLNQ